MIGIFLHTCIKKSLFHNNVRTLLTHNPWPSFMYQKDPPAMYQNDPPVPLHVPKRHPCSFVCTKTKSCTKTNPLCRNVPKRRVPPLFFITFLSLASFLSNGAECEWVRGEGGGEINFHYSPPPLNSAPTSKSPRKNERTENFFFATTLNFSSSSQPKVSLTLHYFHPQSSDIRSKSESMTLHFAKIGNCCLVSPAVLWWRWRWHFCKGKGIRRMLPRP